MRRMFPGIGAFTASPASRFTGAADAAGAATGAAAGAAAGTAAAAGAGASASYSSRRTALPCSTSTSYVLPLSVTLYFIII